MLVSTYWPYYSEMECKGNYRRVVATCLRKVYDNDKKYYTPWPEPPLNVEALGFSLPSL